GVHGVLVGRVAAGDDFDRVAAELAEFVEQHALGGGVEAVAARMGDDGDAAGTLDPAHGLVERGPAVRHVAGFAFAEVFAEDLGGAGAAAGLDDVAGEVGARQQIGVADVFQGALIGVKNAGLFQLGGNL